MQSVVHRLSSVVGQMKLGSALGLTRGDVVAFVGGGGKTTAMFRLAAEIVGQGGRVITTTTTRIFAAQIRLAPVHVQSLPSLSAALSGAPHVLITGQVDAVEGKAFGVAPSLISDLRALTSNLQPPTSILVEADGSRMRPFKAPADHEPVIPKETTIVVPVVGIDIIGRPLTAEYVHRPELIEALAPIRLGQIITPEIVAAVIAHPMGGRKNVPTGARVIALINKVESDGELAAARKIAELLIGQAGIDGVAIGAVGRDGEAIVQTFYRE
ncbi:MAG: selenium cofactor biosynthesis protein YqeC [Chloroflexota bacterium]